MGNSILSQRIDTINWDGFIMLIPVDEQFFSSLYFYRETCYYAHANDVVIKKKSKEDILLGNIIVCLN